MNGGAPEDVDPLTRRRRAVWRRLVAAQLILAALVLLAVLAAVLAAVAGIGVFAHRAL